MQPPTDQLTSARDVTDSRKTPAGGLHQRMVLDGVEVEIVPCDELPVTNMCNYCVLKGTACYSRSDVDCHADSRPDGVGVVFRKVQNSDCNSND